MEKDRIKVIYEDKFNMVKGDNMFSYCMVDKDKYLLLKKNNYKGNIIIYFYNKYDKEYGLTIDKIDSVKVV